MTWSNFFLPHKDTHQKAHLISWQALFAYLLLFIFLQVGLSALAYNKPGVLGITGNIDQKKLIELTNNERAKQGLPPVVENEALDRAASLKAQNMFAENYWAHFAPSGKTPWDFILNAGYKFTYAGENLAKNFYNSDDVVSAWMASPTHRDNVLSSKYQDIGIAVVEGVLNGQKTTLVVQEFGSTDINPALSGVKGKQTAAIPQATVPPATAPPVSTPLIASVVETKQNIKPIIDPYIISKTAGLSVISLIVILLIVDFMVLRRRRVFRLSSQHLAHMALLSLTAGSMLMTRPGVIL